MSNAVLSMLKPYTEAGRWGDVARRHITQVKRLSRNRRVSPATIPPHVTAAVQAAKAAAHFARIALGEHQ